MLILCSNGLSSHDLQNRFRQILHDARTAALVVTADPEYKDNNYHVPRCVSELNSIGLSVQLFDLDLTPARELLNYDVVEFIGGNPFYLLHSIRRSNASNILKTIMKTKILIGWSAAVFVFGPTLDLVNRYSPEMNFLNLTDLDRLHLTELQVLPHYTKFRSRIPLFEEICQSYEKESDTTVIRINDGDGIFLDEDGIPI